MIFFVYNLQLCLIGIFNYFHNKAIISSSSFKVFRQLVVIFIFSVSSFFTSSILILIILISFPKPPVHLLISLIIIFFQLFPHLGYIKLRIYKQEVHLILIILLLTLPHHPNLVFILIQQLQQRQFYEVSCRDGSTYLLISIFQPQQLIPNHHSLNQIPNQKN